eukprot:maker-scaffold_4-snap-gene-12.8-mRNA-1 protein AED:0.00 eAED:0.00 QI:133/1/1/1/1/1/2/65/431
MANREHDLLLWGVTGWTGIHTAEYLLKKYSSPSEELLRWAVVARNKEKYEKIKELLISEWESFPNFSSEEEVSKFVNNIPIYFTSNDDEQKVSEIVSKSLSVCSVVGPFMKYGETLLKQCVVNNTHYTDITGETIWINDMLNKYGKEASENGTWLIPSCGFDSIPSQVSSYLCIKELQKENLDEEGEVVIQGNLITMAQNNRDTSIKKQPAGGGGTAATMLEAFIVNSPEKKPKYPSNPVRPKYDKELAKLKLSPYRCAFIMADGNQKNVYLTQRSLKSYPKNLKYTEAMLQKSYMKGLAVPMVMGLGMMALKTPGLSSIVKSKLPKPSSVPVKLSTTNYKPGGVEFMCLGTASGTDVKVMTKVTLPDEGGWTETAKMMVEAALTLVLDDGVSKVREDSGINGGIVTGACLGDSYIERLKKVDVKFEVTRL